MKTIKEWAEHFPEDIKKRFLKNFENSDYYNGKEIKSLGDAINWAFYWEDTEEGHKFWSTLKTKAINGEFNNLPKNTMEDNLDKIIADAESIIAKAKETLQQEKLNKKKIRPSEGEKYWYIGCEVSYIGIDCDYYGNSPDFNKKTWSIGNGFFTVEEAYKELTKRQAIQRVKDYLIENDLLCSEEEEKDNDFKKFIVVYNLNDCKIKFDWSYTKYYSPFGLINKRSEEFIKDCEEDLKIIFNVK